jgi:hypothetical protein
MKENTEYLEGINMLAGEVNPSPGSKIRIELSHYFDKPPHGDPFLLVASLQKGNKIKHYRTWEIYPGRHHTWEKSEVETDFPESSSDDDILKVYLWNTGRQDFYLDDFIIALREPLQ